MKTTLLIPCPACRRAPVRVTATRWQVHGTDGRCVHLDDPVRCVWNCALTPLQVEAVLRLAYQQQGDVVRQLALPLELVDTLRVA